ncbi:MAG TPA: prolyl oligopeptidase family serine peptidase [Myxococcales bacterium]
MIATALALTAALAYPQARKDTVADDHFGHAIQAPYRWMEQLDSPDVQRWVEGENALTQSELAHSPDRERLKARLTSLWNYERTDVPRREAGELFFRKNSGLQKQSVVYREMPGQEPLAVLDPNALFPSGDVAVARYAVSPDAKYLAYTTAQGGSDLEDIHVRDLSANQDLKDVVLRTKFGDISWSKDSKGFTYSRFKGSESAVAFSGANKNHQVFFHRLGQSKDTLLFERPEAPGEFVSGTISDDGHWLVLSSSSGTTNNRLFVVNLGDVKKPRFDGPRMPVCEEEDSRTEALGFDHGLLYLSTTFQAPNRRIVAVKPGDANRAHWRTVVPEEKFPIHDAALASGRLVVARLVDVQGRVSVYDLSGKRRAEVALPEPGTVEHMQAKNDDPEVFFHFTSVLRPRSVFRYQLATGKVSAFDTPHTAFDASPYETRALFYPSKDGTRIPLFVTLRKGTKLDGNNNALLYAYGGFDIAITPAFSATTAAWLDAGGIYAVANLRGGFEYGEAWHKAGMRERKQNVFDDFIAAAQYLVKEGYTKPSRLAVQGRSNGGLLIGAVMTERPDLFGVALPGVGVMDMLRFQKFTGGALWEEEYGSPDDPHMFPIILAYSPLHNLKPGTCYPATFITTADRDDRVVPSHSFKFAAALQAAQGCDKPVLIRVEKAGSHGYRPTDRVIAEAADWLAFTLMNLGEHPKPVQ